MVKESTMRITGLICALLVAALSWAIAEEEGRTEAAQELEQALRDLNRPQENGSHLQHPGWHDSQVKNRLKRLVETQRGTEEALTAEFWLATASLEVSQATTDRKARREQMLSVCAAYDRLIKESPRSWRAKAARIGRCFALYGASEFDCFRSETVNVFSNISAYATETNANFVSYLQAYPASVAEVECELRFLRVVAACSEGKFDRAIEEAEELQNKHPEWSQRRRIPGKIAMLKNGQNPFGLAR